MTITRRSLVAPPRPTGAGGGVTQRIATPSDTTIRVVGNQDTVVTARQVRPPCPDCRQTGLRMPAHAGKNHKSRCPGCQPCVTCKGTGRTEG